MSFPDASHSAHHGNKGLVACVVYPLQDFGSTCGSSPLACCMESTINQWSKWKINNNDLVLTQYDSGMRNNTFIMMCVLTLFNPTLPRTLNINVSVKVTTLYFTVKLKIISLTIYLFIPDKGRHPCNVMAHVLHFTIPSLFINLLCLSSSQKSLEFFWNKGSKVIIVKLHTLLTLMCCSLKRFLLVNIPSTYCKLWPNLTIYYTVGGT